MITCPTTLVHTSIAPRAVIPSSTQTLVGVEGTSANVHHDLTASNQVLTAAEHPDLHRRDGQRSSWPDVINKASEIHVNIGGLHATLRIGFVILLVLVLCAVFTVLWRTSSAPTGSQLSDVPVLDLFNTTAVNVSTAEGTKSIKSFSDVRIGSEDDGSETQSAQTVSTSSPAVAGFTDGEVSQVLEKAIQDLRYPTDQNETIEELQALNRGLILKAHQEALEETIQTLKKRVIRLIAWCSVVAIADPLLARSVIAIKGLLRLYWYRGQEFPIVHERFSSSPLQDWYPYTIGSAFGGSISWPFSVRIILQFLYLGSAIYCLCLELVFAQMRNEVSINTPAWK